MEDRVSGSRFDWRSRWGRIGLARQFAFASLLVICLGMFVLGHWINLQIRQGVIHHTASTTVLYMESLVEPLVQNLVPGKPLSEESNKALDNLLTGPLKEKLVSLKIWNTDSSIAYSNFPELIGVHFKPEVALEGALRGDLMAELGAVDSAESYKESSLGMELLEIYVPLYQSKSGKLIGAGEFYLNADELLSDLRQQTLLTWLIVALLTVLMVSILSLVMFRASQTIDRQKRQLDKQVANLSKLLSDNHELSGTLKKANKNAAALNDQLLNRLSSDLHDGPAQLLSFALLRLPSLAHASRRAFQDQCSAIQKAVEDGLRDIRLIASGLNMPMLEGMPLEKVLEVVVKNHEKVTGTNVLTAAGDMPTQASVALKACVYRVIQEGLTNAYKHGGGIGQVVTIYEEKRAIVVEVSDAGKGFEWNPQQLNADRLGIVGLQNRIQAFGGSLIVDSSPGNGSRLKAIIPIMGEGKKNG